MSQNKKLLKNISFTYTLENEKRDPKSIFVGYYKNVKVSDANWLEFYNTLTNEQKMLLLKLYGE